MVLRAKNDDDVKRVLGTVSKTRVILFGADWNAPSMQVDAVLEELLEEENAVGLWVDPEAIPDVATKYQVTSVPVTAIWAPGSKTPVLVKGANVASIVKEVTKACSVRLPRSAEDLTKRLERLTKAASVMVFMKGDPSGPKCKFSRALVELLKRNEVAYSYFDILLDDEVRQGLKTFSNWKTFPQVYVDGKLVGGLDILVEMEENDELRDALHVEKQEHDLTQRIKDLIVQDRVMLFMKGTKERPECGFSRTMVQLLQDAGFASYSTFNILEDADVRQGLKEYSKWPTYPQLYIDGTLIGGLDICKELYQDGDLQELAASNE